MVTINSAVIFLVGDEKYLKEKAVSEIKSALLDSACGELDYKVLHGAETSADEILDCASTIPFFSSKRLVVVKEFQKLSKEDTPRLISYIKNPSKHTCLVFDLEDDDILEKDPSLNKHVKVLKFTDLTDLEISKWITRYLSSKGKGIEEDALEILKELQGGNLLNLSHEVDKLVTFIGSRHEITKDDVEALVGKSFVVSAFDIADAVGSRDTSRAIEIVYELLESGKRPYEIVGLLSWHFKRIVKAKMLLSKGRTEYSVTQDLRISRKNSFAFFTQVQSFSMDDISSKMEMLLEADLGIKRARYSPSMVLEFAVIRLCL